MRVSVNVTKIAMQLIASDATRVRVKRDEQGNVMLLPTSRKVISGLDKLGEVARKITRDTRSGTATIALNFDSISEGNYSIVQAKHSWLMLVKMDDSVVPALNVQRVRMTRKSG
jgi:hypothetical protein